MPITSSVLWELWHLYNGWHMIGALSILVLYVTNILYPLLCAFLRMISFQFFNNFLGSHYLLGWLAQGGCTGNWQDHNFWFLIQCTYYWWFSPLGILAVSIFLSSEWKVFLPGEGRLFSISVILFNIGPQPPPFTAHHVRARIAEMWNEIYSNILLFMRDFVTWPNRLAFYLA